MFSDLIEGKVITHTIRDNTLYPFKKKGEVITLKPISIKEVNIKDIICYELEGLQAIGIVKAMNPLYGVLVGGYGPGKTKGWTHTVLGVVI